MKMSEIEINWEGHVKKYQAAMEKELKKHLETILNKI